MNKQRRKDIEKATALLEQAREIIDTAQEEEQESYDNLPESIQDSERGEAMYTNIDTLQTASDNIGDALDTLEEIE